MAPNYGQEEDSYSFSKLKGPENYEQWSNNMAAALGSTGHWVFVDDPESRKEPPAITPKPDDDEDRTERIYQRDERRAKYFGDIQREGGTLKKGNLAPKDLWEHLQKMCTDHGWGVKWNLINRIGSDTILKADSEVEANALLSRCTDLVGKLATHKMTIEEVITIMVLNQLPSQFDTIKEIKRNEAKCTDSVPKLNAIVEVIKDNMRNRHQSSVVANFIGQKDKGKGKGNDNGKGKGNNTRSVCSFKPCGRKGHTIDNCALAHPELANEIFAEVKKKKEEKVKKEKENKDKDNKKGAYDVHVITALNVSASNIPASSPPKPSIEELRRMVDEMKNMF
ncbi:MAG: hypothetical protein Q9179_004678 [Wetmoreana sp. 5 TL-2023]